MQITFLGGADEVGASSTLIQMGGKTLLVDTGIRISPRSNRGIQNDQLPDLRPISEAGGLDYILVTHAHTDHTGALPLVVEQYPHVPVLATRPTADLVRILQADAQRIMHSRQEEEGELPLFDELAAERLINAFQPVDFRQPIRLGDGLQVTFHPAGHIAGAAMLVLESEEGTLVMSGDVSLGEQRAVCSAAVPNIKADALVLESTYGGKLHANRMAEEKRLIETLRQIAEDGGKALIPAFALGRAQEILQILLAYRDQLDIPVYADGMVRSVCRAYAGFSNWLPPNTTRAAGDDHLFFRNKIKAIDNTIQRDEVINSTGPAVIVASSGMLTGGASVIYAKHLAGDPRNAILLTGYQDEESPGRFLQKVMRERQEGDDVSLRIDNENVSLRAAIGSYSLSAHADEAELITIAEALKAEEVLLVHGDPGARHSLATNLRQREKHVHTPKIGQTITFSFTKRPWALGGITSGSQTRPFDAAELWDALKPQAGSFFSAAELARMWWGDPSRAAQVISTLSGDELYFAADWRSKSTFRVRTSEQVERTQRQRAIMLANPDIVGKLIVLRDSNNRPRIGFVTNANIEGFEATVHNAKGKHYPGDALLWPIGPWDRFPTDADGKRHLSNIYQQAKDLSDQFLPFAQRQEFVRLGQPVNPNDLLPRVLTEGVSRDLALLAVVLALAQDGATLEANGLLPKHALQEGPLEMNQARQTALALFPPESRLRKVGMEVARRRITLTFDFPTTAQDRYAEQIQQVLDLTGWDVIVNPQVNQQALGAAINEFLPSDVRILKGPSFFLDRREVQIEVDAPGDFSEIEYAYRDLTGFRLAVVRRGEPTPSNAAVSVPTGNQMEINTAYAVIKQALDRLGLYKTSLKQNQIVLSFISPQIGERHRDIINTLAQETGYPISIHPNPNQQQILQVASQLMREAGWQIRKGPGIHVDRAEISITLGSPVSEADIERVNRNLIEETGYSLVVG
jgi:Cft2 family RNA processing exonuclease